MRSVGEKAEGRRRGHLWSNFMRMVVMMMVVMVMMEEKKLMVDVNGGFLHWQHRRQKKYKKLLKIL